jgi:NitT/TauT family transport system substrate-binding protein
LNVAEIGGSVLATTIIGENAGIFKHYGLNLNLSFVAGITPSIGDVLSGTAQIGFTSIGGLLPADEAGDNVQLIANVETDGTKLLAFPNNTDSLMVAAGSSITSPAQLVGKTVGLVNLVGTGALQADIAVTQAGGKWSQVSTVVVPFANMPAELANGTIAAAVEIQPFSSQSGQHLLTNLDASTIGVVPNAYFATNSYIAAHPSVIKAFAEAQQESILYTEAHQNKITPTILAEAAGVPTSEASQFTKPPVISFSTSLNPTGLIGYEDTAAAYGFLTGPVMPVSALVYTAPGTPMTTLLFNAAGKFVGNNVVVSRITGVAVPGRAVVMRVLGSNFSKTSKVTSNAVGTTVRVVKTKSTVLSLLVTTRAGTGAGVHLLTIRFANGQVGKIRYNVS